MCKTCGLGVRKVVPWRVVGDSRGLGLGVGVLHGASLLFLMHRSVCLVTTEHCTFLTQVRACRRAP